MPDVQHKRGTRASLDALAGTNGLKPGQIYLLTDESRLAIALSINTYETYAKQSEAGGGGFIDGGDAGSVYTGPSILDGGGA